MFRSPSGQVLVRAPQLPEAPDGAEHIRAANDDRGLRLDDQTGVTRWYGEALDYSIALGALAVRRPASGEGGAGGTPGAPSRDPS